jgi:serine/threonine-protein kinase HipA
MKRFQQFATAPSALEDSLRLFTLIVLNCAIRNGDAHLKNFGIVYDNVQGEAHLAPVYDLVTTTVYIPQDRMALTLNGANQWPTGKELIRFGEGRSLASGPALLQTLECVCDALSDTEEEMLTYGKEHSEFAEVAGQMSAQWKIGRDSLSVPRN